MQEVGKNKRLKRIFSHPSGKIVIVPLDDSLLSGPTNGLEELRAKTKKVTSAQPNAIIGFQGLLKYHSDIIENTPTILNLTASTTNVLHTRKSLISNLETAVQLCVEAVAVHVNISSMYENEMLSILGRTAIECQKYGMPLMGIMYPRKENIDGSDNNYSELKKNDKEKYTTLVAHAARVGMELGVDIIKTQYTGSIESFEKVVKACAPVPVVIAGGLPLQINNLLDIAENVVKAGGAGVSFGRNIFTRENPIPYIEAIKDIILESITQKEVLNKYKNFFNE